jgi:hypothetical protein
MATPEQTVNNRLVLLTIVGIPLTMILAATWLWYFVVRGDLDIVGLLGTANRGDLVQPPRALTAVGLLGDGGRPLDSAGLQRHWTMLVPFRGPGCDEACEHNLYTTRQIHLAMGKQFNRIQRYLVSDHGIDDTALTVGQLSDGHPLPADFRSYLSREHRGLTALRISPVDYATLFPEQIADTTTWYLVDPGGWIMMSYDERVHYKDVMADLKFLLKNSNE